MSDLPIALIGRTSGVAVIAISFILSSIPRVKVLLDVSDSSAVRDPCHTMRLVEGAVVAWRPVYLVRASLVLPQTWLKKLQLCSHPFAGRAPPLRAAAGYSADQTISSFAFEGWALPLPIACSVLPCGIVVEPSVTLMRADPTISGTATITIIAERLKAFREAIHA